MNQVQLVERLLPEQKKKKQKNYISQSIFKCIILFKKCTIVISLEEGKEGRKEKKRRKNDQKQTYNDDVEVTGLTPFV